MHVIVVGAGVCGLTVAKRFSDAGWVVTLLDQHDRAGGLNRSWYENGEFCEHAPRVFSHEYKEFRELLSEMGMDFLTFFGKPYTAPLFRAETLLSHMTPRELLVWGWDIYLGREESSVHQFVTDNNFSARAKAFVDLVCRTLDGGGSDRFRRSQLRALAALPRSSLVLPTQPLGRSGGLFDTWGAHLRRRGVHVVLNNKVGGVRRKDNGWAVTTDKATFLGDVVVFAMPPESVVGILPRQTTLSLAYAYATRYETYRSVALRYDSLPTYYSGVTEWGIAVVPLVDGDHTILSTAATRGADHVSDETLVSGIVKQLGLPDPLGFCVRGTPEPSYFHAVGTLPVKFTLPWKGLFSVGTHNGHGKFPATSVETAVNNANAFCQQYLNNLL